MPQSVLTFEPHESNKIRSYRKEKSFWKQLSLVDLVRGKEAVTVRWYGAGEVSYCCVWVSGGMCRGAGKAGGGGYHKASASFHYALVDAGFTMADDVDGRGDAAVEEALKAIAAYLEIERPMIVYAHG